MLATLALITVARTPQVPTIPKDGIAFTTKVTKSYRLNYLASVPADYTESTYKKYPLIVFLHGSGERGEDLNAVRVHGPFAELATGRKFPFVIVAPQCPNGTWWDIDVLQNMLRDVQKRYRIDRDRIYLTGLSMGGFGTWAWACAEPKTFAAIAPICGGGSPEDAKKIAKLPTWVTHGDADPAVPIQASIDMVEALKKAGGDVRFDIIKGGGHNVWTPVYASSELYDWFLTKRRVR